mgnify:CR=1 FL=1
MISMFKNSVMAFVLMFSSMGAFAGINGGVGVNSDNYFCLLYTSPSPRD